MSFKINIINTINVMVLENDADVLASERDLDAYIGDAWAADARWLVVPLDKLAPQVLDLKTGLLGAMLQKAVNYKLGVAIIGDVAALSASGRAMHDYIHESNQGRHVWFLEDLRALEGRL